MYSRRTFRAGLSPRVRRHPQHGAGPPGRTGSISACAEASCIGLRWRQPSRVYLRVCGGISCFPTGWRGSTGLSPRVRRHRIRPSTTRVRIGSISACAEASAGRSARPHRCEVYLRVCGGICIYLLTAQAGAGLSPRVRRHPTDPSPLGTRIGSISACAEASARSHVRASPSGVYLRVCGGILVCAA